MVPVPVPTFEKVTIPVPVPAPYLDHKKQIFQKNFGIFFAFLLSKVFYKEKVYKFQQIYCKMWMKKILNEGNQIHNFISSSGSGTVINYGSGSDFLTNYGSGSTSQKVMVPTVPVQVPVPQHWFTASRTCYLVPVVGNGTFDLSYMTYIISTRRFTWALGRDGELNHPELYNQKQFSRRSSASLREE